MTIYTLGSFLVYVMINAFTPGPGNILALNTATVYGYKKGRPLVLGIFSGYYVVQSICAIFVYGVVSFLPHVLGVLKYIGAAYILWLAVSVAISKPKVGNIEGSSSFFKGFLLQFVNIKIYLLGITALTGYITNYSTSLGILFLFEMIIATIGVIATATWVGVGIIIQRFYHRHYKVINIILAILLLECAYSMLK